MAVKRVDLNRNPAEDGGDATQYPRLCRVGVDNVRPELTNLTTYGQQSPEVAAESYRPSERLNALDGQVRIPKLYEVGFLITDATAYQACRERSIGQASGQHARLPRRPTDVHPGQDSQNPDLPADRSSVHGPASASQAWNMRMAHSW